MTPHLSTAYRKVGRQVGQPQCVAAAAASRTIYFPRGLAFWFFFFFLIIKTALLIIKIYAQSKKKKKNPSSIQKGTQRSQSPSDWALSPETWYPVTSKCRRLWVFLPVFSKVQTIYPTLKLLFFFFSLTNRSLNIIPQELPQDTSLSPS